MTEKMIQKFGSTSRAIGYQNGLLVGLLVGFSAGVMLATTIAFLVTFWRA